MGYIPLPRNPVPAHNAPVVSELLDTLAHGIPDLHGAACRGHPELFDADRHGHQAITAAKAVCASCPVLGRPEPPHPRVMNSYARSGLLRAE